MVLDRLFHLRYLMYMVRKRKTPAGIKQSRSSQAALKVFMLFVETAHAVLKDADKLLHQAVGLSTGQFVVLMVLSYSGGTITSAKLAERTGTRPHNITTLVDRMELNGLVATERRETDRRFVYIMLTDKGRSVLEKAMPAARKVVAKATTTLAEPELAELERFLITIKQNVKEVPGK